MVTVKVCRYGMTYEFEFKSLKKAVGFATAGEEAGEHFVIEVAEDGNVLWPSDKWMPLEDLL